MPVYKSPPSKCTLQVFIPKEISPILNVHFHPEEAKKPQQLRRFDCSKDMHEIIQTI